MHFLQRARWGMSLAAIVVAVAGCLPNRAALSPDGRQFYFATNDDAGFEIKDSSHLYALDIETGRLQALTDAPGSAFWCSISSNGRLLAYMTGVDNQAALRLLDLEDGSSRPLTGVLTKFAYPWLVPGDPVYLLAMAELGKDQPQWAIYGEDGRGPAAVPLTPLAEYKAGFGNVGLAALRVAVPVHREAKSAEAKEGETAKYESAVWVIDLAKPAAAGAGDSAEKPWPAVTCVARWTDLATADPIIDVAFSADGKRLAAAILGAIGKKEETRFFEVDPTGQAQPKVLFDAPHAYYPQWTPDGGGLVYLRACAGNDKWREVVLWRPEAKEPLVLARLPGEFGKAYTTWFWMPDGRLRVYHVSDEGIYLVETSADGQGAKARRLTRERVKAQKGLADFERGFGWASVPASSLAETEWPQPLAAAMKAVAQPMQDAAKPTEDALRAAWRLATVWDDVPAAPAVPTAGNGD